MGSLRNPAAFNGVIGMRPSIGRVPTVPGLELFFQQIGTLGPMGRTVADVAQLLATMAGYHSEAPLSLGEPAEALAGGLDSELRGLRIGWLGDLGGHLPFEHGILSLCRAAAERMQQVFVTIVTRTQVHPRATN